MSELNQIQEQLRKFVRDREWDQFHAPKNLVMALASEVGELTEIFQWMSEDESKKEALSDKDLNRVREELADVFLYLVRLTDKLEIDIISAAEQKIANNATKYPIELSKGNATKYNQRNA